MFTRPIPKPGSQTRLAGRRLLIAWIAGGALVALVLAALLPMLPTYVNALATICSGASCPTGQLTPAAAQALRQMGLSVGAYVAYSLVLTLLALVMCWSVAAVLFWRRSDDWMGLLVGLMLVLMATTIFTYLLLQRPSAWQVPALLLNTLAWAACFFVFFLFPSGRFVPTWMGWLPGAWIAWILVSLCWLNTPVFFPLYYLVWLALLLGVLGAQLYRYRQVSTLAERQQTKWVVWGFLTASVIAVAVVGPRLIAPGFVQQNVWYQLLGVLADATAIFLASLSIGLAILRSRLWEIDHLINRTLVYGSLTGLLALVYVSLVIGLQALVHLVTGGVSQSTLVSVVSTLAIAALFQPLRHRLQRIIDRRFYRRKYDAAQTLAAFGETMRREVDLNDLCEQLVAVVQETMQPAHISLWLIQPANEETRQTRVLPRIDSNWDED